MAPKPDEPWVKTDALKGRHLGDGVRPLSAADAERLRRLLIWRQVKVAFKAYRLMTQRSLNQTP